MVPKAARSGLLKSIHNSHLGVNGCLYRARECLYWPGMTGDIKNYVSTCEACREYEQGQRKETLTSHEAPSRPWQFVAADLFESTLSDEKLFIEIAFAECFSHLLSNIQSEQSYDHTSHVESQKRDLNCCQQWR